MERGLGAMKIAVAMRVVAREQKARELLPETRVAGGGTGRRPGHIGFERSRYDRPDGAQVDERTGTFSVTGFPEGGRGAGEGGVPDAIGSSRRGRKEREEKKKGARDDEALISVHESSSIRTIARRAAVIRVSSRTISGASRSRLILTSSSVIIFMNLQSRHDL